MQKYSLPLGSGRVFVAARRTEQVRNDSLVQKNRPRHIRQSHLRRHPFPRSGGSLFASLSAERNGQARAMSVRRSAKAKPQETAE